MSLEVSAVMALHTLAAVFWIGGIGFATFALLPSLQRMETPIDYLPVLRQAILRFRKLAMVSAAVLIVSGTYRLYTAYGGVGYPLISGPKGALLIFMFLGWLVLSAAIILLPRREMRILDGLEAESLKGVEGRQRANASFKKMLKRIQLAHYAVTCLGILLILDGMLLVYGL